MRCWFALFPFVVAALTACASHELTPTWIDAGLRAFDACGRFDEVFGAGWRATVIDGATHVGRADESQVRYSVCGPLATGVATYRYRNDPDRRWITRRIFIEIDWDFGARVLCNDFGDWHDEDLQVVVPAEIAVAAALELSGWKGVLLGIEGPSNAIASHAQVHFRLDGARDPTFATVTVPVELTSVLHATLISVTSGDETFQMVRKGGEWALDAESAARAMSKFGSPDKHCPAIDNPVRATPQAATEAILRAAPFMDEAFGEGWTLSNWVLESGSPAENIDVSVSIDGPRATGFAHIGLWLNMPVPPDTEPYGYSGRFDYAVGVSPMDGAPYGWRMRPGGLFTPPTGWAREQ